MQDDIIIDGINISAMHRNFKRMAEKINQQGNTISLLQKNLRLAFGRIDKLSQITNKKQTNTPSNPFAGIFK